MLTLATFSDRRFDRTLETGCANGMVTAHLALYYERLLAIDSSKTAQDMAQARCISLSWVAFERIG